MPHRSGLSHAMLAVVLSALWVVFNRSLSVVIRDEHFLAFVEWAATMVHEHTGLSVEYGTVVTLVLLATVTVLGFAWGYTFHLRRFGRGR